MQSKRARPERPCADQRGLLAHGFAVGKAELALAAAQVRMDTHTLSEPRLGHARPDTLDAAGNLVAERRRQCGDEAKLPERDQTLHEPSCADAHEYLAGPEIGLADLLKPQRFGVFVCASRPHQTAPFEREARADRSVAR